MAKIGKIQLGKQGISENFISTLQDIFKHHENVRVSVLKSARDLAQIKGDKNSQNRSAGQEKEKVKEYSEKILEKLGKNYTSKIIGFTIVLKKWRKAVR